MRKSFFILNFILLLITKSALTETNTISSNNSQNLINQLFSEQTLTVTKEGDALLAGTFRTVLMRALGIRQNNPFTVVTINFDPSIKKIYLSKGNLPSLDKGLITIDCAGKVTLDGSQINSSELQTNEKVVGIHFSSSGNFLKGCRFIGFKGSALVISGNRNQIRGNFFGDSSKNNNINTENLNDSISNGTAISILDESSDNLIESNEFINNKQEGVVLSSQVGSGNRIIGNSFINNGQKEIRVNQNRYQTPKLTLRPIVKEGDVYIISGTLSEPSEIEFLMAYSANKENKLTTIIPAISLGKGDFSLSVKNKGFTPGSTKIVALSTATGKNTSELSESTLIPIDPPKIIPSPETPSVREIAREEPKEKNILSNLSNEKEEKKNTNVNTIKPINERASSALSAEPTSNQGLSALSNSSPEPTELSPTPVYQPPLPSFVKPGETTINLSSNPKKSGGSDSVITHNPFEPTNPP